ncbi:MAG: TldD/PmbA family protein [Dehalococcoidia bacterium]|nr:TldD/PmbA family protein [Dehalococcoidia bacterium]
MQGEGVARRLAERALRLSAARDTEITIATVDSSLTRFARNEVHQNVTQRDTTVSIRAGYARRYGTAATNDLSDAGLRAAAEQALAIAQALPDEAEFLPLASPQPLPAAGGFSISTAEHGPMQRAAAVRAICGVAASYGLHAAGAFRDDTGETVIASSAGLFARHAWTSAELTTVMLGEDSSGYAGRLAANVDEIDGEAVAREAAGKAVRGRNPQAAAPGEYDVVLEPPAVSDLLDFLGYVSFGALAVQEGRSFLTGRLGQRVMSEQVTIADDPLDASGLVRPFDAEGAPAQRVEMIKDGVAHSPVYDRRTAAKAGARSTGHALSAESAMGPLPLNMSLARGQKSVEELVAGVRRGLLVTRFWYTRVVHPLTVQMTGMTRDGTFLIENGEVAGAVRNLRFTESYLEALGRVQGVGRELRLVREFFAANRVPALAVAGWHFTGAAEH